jgi:hypothetical protein
MKSYQNFFSATLRYTLVQALPETRALRASGAPPISRYVLSNCSGRPGHYKFWKYQIPARPECPSETRVYRRMSILVFSFVLVTSFYSYADNVGTALSNLGSSFSGAGSSLVQGLGESVGIVSSDYKYSCRFFNDTPAAITAAIQRVTPVLGAKFSGEVTKNADIFPFQNSGDKFYGLQLYFTIWMLRGEAQNYQKYGSDVIKQGAIIGSTVPGLGSAIGALIGSVTIEKGLQKGGFFLKQIWSGIKNDNNIYFYRAYTDKGEVKGEYLGVCSTSKEFVGIFYNSTAQKDISVKYIVDKDTYQATLEPGTFNLLSNANPSAIRPPTSDEKRAFIFYKGTDVLSGIPVTSEGIATLQIDPKSDPQNPKYVVGAPYAYTYEVYQGDKGPAVGLQGLAIGNHVQTIALGADGKADPTKSVVRDISPVVCHIWVQSAQQFNQQVQKKDPKAVPAAYDAPEQLWVAYKIHDMTLYKKLDLGKQTDVTFLRPQFSEAQALLYIVAVQTNDDAKAQQFLERLTSGKLVQGSLEVPTKFDTATLLATTLQPNEQGIIDDTQGPGASGVRGWILLTDTFLPRGVGTGPFYYTTLPALLDIDSLTNPLIPFLDTKAMMGGSQEETALSQALYKIVQGWLTAYQKSPNEAKNAVGQTIQQYGYDSIKKDKKLSDQLITIVVDGPVGLAHLPLRRQAGICNYVYNFGEKPDDWLS